MPWQVIPCTTYNSLRAGRIPSILSTPTPSFPPASISEVFDMSTTHQPTPDPSANLSQPSANPSTGPSSAPSAILATGNPQPINVTMMANAINDLVKSNLPSRVKIREPDPFNGSNPKKLHTFLLQCKLNFRDCKDLFQDETTKVNYVLSYLKGSALYCFEARLWIPSSQHGALTLTFLVKNWKPTSALSTPLGKLKQNLKDCYVP